MAGEDDEELIDIEEDSPSGLHSYIDEIEDEESRQLIKAIMVAENESPFETMEMPFSIEKPVTEKRPFSTETSLSDNKLLSSHTIKGGASTSSNSGGAVVRWSDAEDDKFLEGLQLYGYGNWKKISNLMKTRSALQVKNRARHILDSMDSTIKPGLVEKVRHAFMDKWNGKQAMKIEPQIQKLKQVDTDVVEEEIDILEDEEQEQAELPNEKTVELKEIDREDDEIDSKTEENYDVEEVDPIVTHLQERILSKTEITNDEIFNIPEFFTNKGPKTPDRYLKIRNHIIERWKTVKPEYLTKIHSRKGLKVQI